MRSKFDNIFDIGKDTAETVKEMNLRVQKNLNLVSVKLEEIADSMNELHLKSSGELKEYTENGVVKGELYWKVNRRRKKYNDVSCRMWITLSEENLHQDSFMTNGRISLGSWFCEKGDIIFEVTKFDRFNGVICGKFSGIMKRSAGDGTVVSKRIENGFFDIAYTIVKVPNIIV